MTIVTTNPTQICCDVSILQYWFERETSLLQKQVSVSVFFVSLAWSCFWFRGRSLDIDYFIVHNNEGLDRNL